MKLPLRASPFVLSLAALLLICTACAEEEVASDSSGSARQPASARGAAPAGEPGAHRAEALAASFVGADRCATCHADQVAEWKGSPHERAMQSATRATVLGQFDGQVLRDGASRWRFIRDTDEFVVERTEGAGAAVRLPVTSTFGVYPLQQYLVRREKGRQQALPVAWDARSEADGGQRWFSLQPEVGIDPGDPLHWEQLAYNWNSQCASCHGTAVEVGYDAPTNSFDTRAAEWTVACEACHGAGSVHVARMEGGSARSESSETVRAVSSSAPASTAEWNDFPVRFETWDPTRWQRVEGERISSRVAGREHDAQPDACASCHARRSALVPRPEVGAPFLDGYAPQLLEGGLYFDDGQIREEVYVWGSFEQSRMFQAGVRCGDCHDPHTLTLRQEGNALCATCHSPEAFDTPDHRGHAELAAALECVDCHMPERTYMEIDGRRDHSFLLPRPVRSAALGSPNVCTTCHSDRSVEWMDEATNTWLGGRSRAQRWPDFLVRDGSARTDPARWLEIANDPTSPPLVRGSAWARYAEEAAGAPSLEVLRARLAQAEPVEKLGIIALGRRLAPAVRVSLLRELLGAEERAVRTAAAEALADVPRNVWRPADASVQARGLREYRAAQEANLERPEAWTNLGMLAVREGDLAVARRAYDSAIERAPYFIPAHVQLADLDRAEGDELGAIQHLQEALALDPAAVWVRYALGLAFHRAGDSERALKELERAAVEAPEAARLQLGWALALDAAGQRGPAIDVLFGAVREGVAGGEVRHALVTLLRDAGRPEEASEQARAWLETDSTGRAAALARELGGSAPSGD